ncbi:MAG: M48 family metallopeptidase [Bacteroidales bacterium]|nr:M48 family metallopeptidase [Bacteroidales bacterium]
MNKISSSIRCVIIICAFVITGILSTGCGSVPLTGRKQVLLVSDKEVFEAGLTQYNEYIRGAELSSDSRSTALVKSVGSKLAQSTERYLKANGFESELDNLEWEFNLVKSNEVNAFCMPGGKIVVYEGLLSVAQTEAELATVIGHEIGHAVAKHSNERMSQQIMTQYGMAILSQALSQKSAAVQTVATSVFGLGAQVGIMLPYSRKHEYEADYMGIVFMEIAGYDSASALDFWTKMAAGGSNANDFLSTHPSDSKRIAEIKRRIPEAQAIAVSMKN